jgi:hypothetical protein
MDTIKAKLSKSALVYSTVNKTFTVVSIPIAQALLGFMGDDELYNAVAILPNYKMESVIKNLEQNGYTSSH